MKITLKKISILMFLLSLGSLDLNAMKREGDGSIDEREQKKGKVVGESLEKANPNVNVKKKGTSWAPLVRAARDASLGEFQKVWEISKKQNPRTAQKGQQKALITACAFGRYDIAHFILEKDQTLKNCEEPRSGMPSFNLPENVKILSPLFAATYARHAHIVRLLLKHKVVLHSNPFREESDPLYIALQRNNVEIIPLLLEAGAYDCDTFASNPLLPFMWAIGCNYDQKILEKLLAHKPKELTLDDKLLCRLINNAIPAVERDANPVFQRAGFHKQDDRFDWNLITFIGNRLANNDTVRLYMAQKLLTVKAQYRENDANSKLQINALIAALKAKVPSISDAYLSFDLIHAIAEGNIDQLKTLIERFPRLLDQQTYGIYGKTPLNWACYFQQPACVKYLCNRGADITIRSETDNCGINGDTLLLSPFMTTLIRLDFRREDISLEIAKILIAHGVNIDEVYKGERPIDICKRLYCGNAAWLLRRMGADSSGAKEVNQNVDSLLSWRGQRELFLAAKAGNAELLALEVQLSPSQIFLIFAGAVLGNQCNLVKKMCAQESLSLDKTFYEASHGVDLGAAQESLKELTEEGFRKQTPLGFAACNGLKELTGVLLEAGADCAIESYDELVGHQLVPFVSALLRGHYDCATVLLSQKNMIDDQDSSGQTPLDYVILKAQKEALSFLLRNNVNYTSYYDELAFLPAVQKENERRYKSFIDACSRGDIDVVRENYRHFVQTEELTKKCKNPLICASKGRNLSLFQLLLSLGWRSFEGCETDLRDSMDLYPEYFQAFIERIEPELHKDLSIIAVRANKHEHLKMLLKSGIVADPADLLKIAVEKDHKECCELLISFQQDRKLSPEDYAELAQAAHTSEMSTMLMQPDVHREQLMKQFLYLALQGKIKPMPDLNIQDKKGKTLLRRAIDENNQQALDYLLSGEGVDVDMADHAGMTPLMSAAHQGNEKAVHLLCERGASVIQEDQAGCQAYQYAAREGRIELARRLLVQEKLNPEDFLKKMGCTMGEAIKAGFAEVLHGWFVHPKIAQLPPKIVQTLAKIIVEQMTAAGYYELAGRFLLHCEIEFVREFLLRTASTLNVKLTASCIKSLSSELTARAERENILGELRTVIRDPRLNFDFGELDYYYNECQKLLSNDIIEYFQDTEQSCADFVKQCAEFKQTFKTAIGSAERSKECSERYPEFCTFAIKENGQTLLMWACMIGDFDTVLKLIKAGVPESYINHQDKDGKTALMYAVMYNRIECVRALICWERKAEPGHYDNLCKTAMNAKDVRNKSVLWYAVQLAKYDRPIIIRDSAKRQLSLSRMDYSCQFGALKVFSLLCAAGAKFESKKDILEAIKTATELGCNELAVKLLAYCYPDGSPERTLARSFV